MIGPLLTPECMDGAVDTTLYNRLCDDGDDFKILGAAPKSSSAGKQKQKQKQAAEECIICLQPITERAVAAPCNHLAFDFICLVSWLQQRTTCPLCNAVVKEVQYDFCGPEDWKSYHVPRTHAVQGVECVCRDSARRDSTHRRAQQSGSAQSTTSTREAEHPALAFRRQVYATNSPSLHVGTSTHSHHRDFSSTQFAASSTLQSRARTFLRRELLLFDAFGIDGRIRNRDFVMEYIIAILKQHDPKGADGCAVDLLAEIFERGNARLLLHELGAWLRSPWGGLGEWDQRVQYAHPLLREWGARGLLHGGAGSQEKSHRVEPAG